MENWWSFDVTDEELRQELEKMGYDNIPEHTFQHFKRDLGELMRSEEVAQDASAEPIQFGETFPKATLEKPVKCLNTLHKVISQEDAGTSAHQHPEISRPYSAPSRIPSQFPVISDQKVPKPRAHSVNQSSFMNMSTASHTSVSANRVIKRKILRHQDGESIIEETSYVSSISSNAGDYATRAYNPSPPCPDLSQSLLETRKISRSTGAINESGKSGPRKPVRIPAVQYGVKMCDPVIRYHHYRQFWDAFKPPGENSHKQLRWAVREQMLDYDPLVEISLKTIPNMYKVPLEHRRKLPRSSSLGSLSKN